MNKAVFHVAQNLQPHGLEVLKIAGQLQAGASHILHRQADGLVIRRGVGYLHLEFLYQRGQRDAVGDAHMRTLL